MMLAVDVFDNFEKLPPEAVYLFDLGQKDCFFISRPWFEILSKTVIKNKGLKIIFISEVTNGKKNHILITGHENCLDIHGMRFYGYSSLTNFYTVYFHPVCSSGTNESKLFVQLARYMKGWRPAYGVVRMEAIDSAATLTVLGQAFRQAGYIVVTYPSFGSWFVRTCDMTWDAYFGSLPSRLRNTLRRRKQKLGTRISVRIIGDDVPLLDCDVENYLDIYAHSWKSEEAYPDFIPEILRVAAAEKVLQLGFLELDGQPIATQIWIVSNGHATIFKLAYDERFKEYSVGSILSEAMFKHLIENVGVGEINYGAGDEPYKRDWMRERRQFFTFLAFNPRTFRGFLGIVRHVLVPNVRSFLLRAQRKQALTGTVDQ